MSTHKYLDLVCIIVIILALILTLLFINGTSLGVQAVRDEDAEQNSDTVNFTASDLNGTWDNSQTVTVTLDGADGTVKGNGAYFLNGDLVIANAGWYELTGTLTDGSIIIDADTSAKVYLRLSGVTVHCADHACIRVEQADKVFLTLTEGSVNTLTSGTAYSDEATADGADGVIFARDDLTINGTGALTVSGGWKHGIAANDDLVITGGTITVDAVADAIHVNDSLRICEATLVLTGGDEGVDVDSEEEGWFYLESGSVTITAVGDGLHTAGDITLAGGSLTITAGDDGIHSDTNVLITGGTVEIPQCYEGIEAVTITQTGGDVTIYPSDDGYNANGGSGGFGNMGGGFGGRGGRHGDTNAEDTTAADSGEQPAMPESDSDSGERTAPPDFNSEEGERPTMPEGEEGERPTMPEGESGAQPAADTESDTSEDEETFISISGGTVTIINQTGRDADGLDSNGSIYITGGTILVSLSGDGSNNALDWASESGGTAEITGGTVIACGGGSMAEAFSDTSTQPSFLCRLSDTQSAGSSLTLTDSDGETLLSWEIPCSVSAVTISSPQLVQGEDYTLTVGQVSETITLDSVSSSFGTASGGMSRGGR